MIVLWKLYLLLSLNVLIAVSLFWAGVKKDEPLIVFSGMLVGMYPLGFLVTKILEQIHTWLITP